MTQTLPCPARFRHRQPHRPALSEEKSFLSRAAYILPGMLQKISALLLLCLMMISTASAQSFVRDAEIEKYLNTWSTQILQSAGLSPDSVEFILVADPDINAFVTGGQNIFMNTGMIQKADRVEHVMAVVAHEVGHISGGHLARIGDAVDFARLQQLAVTLIGLGAAVATGDSTLGVLGTAGGSDISRRAVSGFTRTQENAADQISINLLNAVGLSADAAAEFMTILERETAVYRNSNRPTYYDTHPATRDRITTMQQAAQASRNRGRRAPQQWQTEFARTQAKLTGFLLPPDQVSIRYPANDSSTESLYARAISTYRRGSLQQGLALIDELLRREPGNAWFHELKGQALFEHGYLNEAAFAYRQAVSLAPEEALLYAGLAHALIGQQQDRNAVEQGLQAVNYALARERENIGFWRLAATGYGRLGADGWASLCLAEAALHSRDFGTAKRLARRAETALGAGTPGGIRASDIQRAANRG